MSHACSFCPKTACFYYYFVYYPFGRLFLCNSNLTQSFELSRVTLSLLYLVITMYYFTLHLIRSIHLPTYLNSIGVSQLVNLTQCGQKKKSLIATS
ncbi:hypothetical protein EV127DRAFT_213224 [Xylaria flabelliformis]|nr:hypothetical protein EV127DRAFT_213224 [Xylaria flabelliformis]